MCVRPSIRGIMESLQVRTFQHDFVPRDPKAKPRKLKYPQFYDPYGPRPTGKIVELADRISALAAEERRQIVPTLWGRLRHPKIQTIADEGMGLGSQGGGGASAGAAKVGQNKEKTAFDVKLEKFEAAAEIKIIKEVRAFTNLDLKEAKDLVEKAP